MTRCGRRCAIAFSAPSESDATRVSNPSSVRMPAISSRISASSSTTRISGDTGDPFCFMHYPFCLCRFPLREKQCHTGARAGLSAVAFAVAQDELAAVVFENLAYDREPESGTLGARRDIGFREAMPIFLRQTDTVVPHGHADPSGGE